MDTNFRKTVLVQKNTLKLNSNMCISDHKIYSTMFNITHVNHCKWTKN